MSARPLAHTRPDRSYSILIPPSMYRLCFKVKNRSTRSLLSSPRTSVPTAHILAPHHDEVVRRGFAVFSPLRLRTPPSRSYTVSPRIFMKEQM